MISLLALILRRFGILDFDILVKYVDRHPGSAEIPLGELWLVIDGGVKKWACLNCPDACRERISLSLNSNHKPSWTIEPDFWGRPTLSPSIHQHIRCRCHFWIIGGIVKHVQ